MKMHEVETVKYKKSTRAGRGISAGRGKTAGRGTKGQNSRTGGGTRPGFEGGQNPLTARLPKFPGFKSKRIPLQNVCTYQLDKLKAASKVDNKSLKEAGLIKDMYRGVKVIFNGEIKTAINLEILAISASAEKAVVDAGGTVTLVERPKRELKKAKTAK